MTTVDIYVTTVDIYFTIIMSLHRRIYLDDLIYSGEDIVVSKGHTDRSLARLLFSDTEHYGSR